MHTSQNAQNIVKFSAQHLETLAGQLELWQALADSVRPWVNSENAVYLCHEARRLNMVERNLRQGSNAWCDAWGEENNPAERVVARQLDAENISRTGSGFRFNNQFPNQNRLDFIERQMLRIKTLSLVSKATGKPQQEQPQEGPSEAAGSTQNRWPWGRPGLYKKTLNVSHFADVSQWQALRPGQWVSVMGATGQYLGVTRSGVILVNYKQGSDMKTLFKANKPLRQYAKLKA